VLLGSLEGDPTALARFQREAGMAATLQHPNIVPVHDVRLAEPRTPPFIAMRFMEGGTLRSRIESRGRAELDQAVEIIRQLASALDYAHSRGIVHRDVKPSNALLDSEGRVYLSDFGIARARDSTILTIPGSTLGTVDYMAPEQIVGADSVDKRADLYALGVVAYELLTGHVPFTADSSDGVRYQHIHTRPRDLAAERPELPGYVGAAVLKMLSKRPDDRLQSGAAFVDQGDSYATRHTPPGSPGRLQWQSAIHDRQAAPAC
jgi:serine/threonine-protein kinase